MIIRIAATHNHSSLTTNRSSSTNHPTDSRLTGNRGMLNRRQLSLLLRVARTPMLNMEDMRTIAACGTMPWPPNDNTVSKEGLRPEVLDL